MAAISVISLALQTCVLRLLSFFLYHVISGPPWTISQVPKTTVSRPINAARDVCVSFDDIRTGVTIQHIGHN